MAWSKSGLSSQIPITVALIRDTTGTAMGVRELSSAGQRTAAEDGMLQQSLTAASPVGSDGTEFFDAHEAMPWSPERPSTCQSPVAVAARRMQLALWPEAERTEEPPPLEDDEVVGGGGGDGLKRASSGSVSAGTKVLLSYYTTQTISCCISVAVSTLSPRIITAQGRCLLLLLLS